MSKYVLTIRPRKYVGLRPVEECEPVVTHDIHIMANQDPKDRIDFIREHAKRGFAFLYVTDADVLSVNGVEPPAQYYYKGTEGYLALIAVCPTVRQEDFVVGLVHG